MMRFLNFRRFASLIAGACALGLAFVAGHALAEGSKLEEAQSNTTKAIVALKAAGSEKASADFETHRKKAVDLLTRAQGEILKAKGE
jgi:hypothetical protein